MHVVQSNSLHSPHAGVVEHSENWMSTPFKILIVAVAAIAAAALGFLVAGLIGLTLGALIGGGLAAACVLLCSPAGQAPIIEQSQQGDQEPPSVGEREVFLALHKICSGPVADDSIRWVMGVPSPYFAQLLALHRQNHDECPPALRNLPLPLGAESTPFPLGHLTSIQRTIPMYVLHEIWETLAPFDLEKELERAHLLPGDTLVQNRINLEWYLEELQQIIGQILQRDASNQQKQELRQHIQEKLLPIFSAMEPLLIQLNHFPVNHSYVEQVRAVNAGPPQDRLYNGIPDERLADYQHAVAHLLTLFEIVQPMALTVAEQELIDYPCPLIFASTTVAAHPPQWVGAEGELAIDQNVLHLGQDLQYVYTTQPNIERIKSIVEPFHMQVRDLMTLAPTIEEQQS